MGLALNTAATANSRGSLATGAGEVITRIDGDGIAGWGTGVPGARTLVGLFFIIQDSNGTTPETFDIVLYPEDAANPDQPDFNDPRPFATGLPGPTGPAGGVAENYAVGPAQPVSVPIHGGGDVFVSFRLPAAPVGDGLGIQVVLGYQVGSFTVWDTPGPALGSTPPPAPTAASSYFSSRVAGNLVWLPRRQHLLDLAHATAGGVGLAVTNQASFPSSHSPSPLGPAGTGDLLSGGHPDVVGSNLGRADDVGMYFSHAGLRVATPVAFLVEFSARFAAEVPVQAFVPGSTGVTCLLQPQVLGFGVTSGGLAWTMTSVPPALRAQLAGMRLQQQAVALDAAGVLHATACDGMRF